jgi:adducin
MREMERRKRVEAIMCSRLFREELERIVDGQMKDGSSAVMQQISDMMGVPVTKFGSIFRGAGCVVPINDIRGIEAMGYEKGEKILRCKLAATFRLLDSYGYSSGIQSIVTARLNADQELFLVNPYGLLLHEVTASSLNKVDMQGSVIEQGTTNFGINTSRKENCISEN